MKKIEKSEKERQFKNGRKENLATFVKVLMIKSQAGLLSVLQKL